MRCPDCNKFVGLDFGDPEVQSLEVDDSGTITCEVRIVRCCAECGQEMKEATLSMECDAPTGLTVGERDDAEWEVEEESVEQVEEGGGRYAKSYFGATVVAKLTVTVDGKATSESVELTDKVAASEMDEMV